MSRLYQTELPYPRNGDISQLFHAVHAQPWSSWLDSGTTETPQARYDFIVAEPTVTLVTRSGVTTITRDGSVEQSDEEPFALLRRELAAYGGSKTDNHDLPFTGGALGYFGYDLARTFEDLPVAALDDLAMPEMAIGIYDWAVVCDRQERRCWLATENRGLAESPRWHTLIEQFSHNRPVDEKCDAGLRARSSVQSNLDRETYTESFKRIQHYLQEGDCYQVNFAQRFDVAVEGDPWLGYLALRGHGAGSFSAYLNTPWGQILSTSPERFLRLSVGYVETRPIKGTRPRAATPAKDNALRDELLKSSKDRAENLMIVDLLRNDLGKSCRTGTVRVPQLFSVESYATVHHLVSSVECQLAEHEDALSLLQGCFPGGSITGAPKLRAMEIIEELEPHRRGVYCGSIGYIGFNGDMDSSIVIRTAIHRNGHLYYSAGGGIVSDSVCEEEYRESFDKAAAFLRCFSMQHT